MSEQPNNGVYVLELELHNVKCFTGPVTIDFRGEDGNWARWSVIIGENGVGKTTVLRAIARTCPFILELKVDSKGKIGGNAMTQSGSGYELEYIEQFKRGEGNSNGHIKLLCLRNVGSIDSYSGRFYWEQKEKPNWRSNYEGDLTYDRLLCIGYGASRKMGSTDQSTNRLQDASNTLFDDEALLANAEELIIRIDYQAKSEKSAIAQKQRDRIQEILLNILPEVKNLKIVQREADFGSEVHFLTPDGWVRLKEMSLGYKTLISWVVDLASKMFIIYRDQEKPLEQPVIVLVDEIDLHMHPRWQRSIMDYLSNIFKRAQFIVTAHSPLIVQAAQDANLILLKRVGDHVEVENDPVHVKNWRIDQILASDLFGGVSAHSDRIQKLLDQRRAILSKAVLTEEDKKEVERLEEEIGPLPAGQTQEEIQMMNIIRKAAEQLK